MGLNCFPVTYKEEGPEIAELFTPLHVGTPVRLQSAELGVLSSHSVFLQQSLFKKGSGDLPRALLQFDYERNQGKVVVSLLEGGQSRGVDLPSQLGL